MFLLLANEQDVVGAAEFQAPCCVVGLLFSGVHCLPACLHREAAVRPGRSGDHPILDLINGQLDIVASVDIGQLKGRIHQDASDQFAVKINLIHPHEFDNGFGLTGEGLGEFHLDER